MLLGHLVNNASNEYHRELVFDAPARMVGRFENFLRDAPRQHALCCGKGQRIVATAIFKTFFKNDRIGTRTHAGEEGSQRGSNPRGSHEPLLRRRGNRGSRPREARTPLPTPVAAGLGIPAWVRSPLRPFFSRMGSSPDSMIFRKRFKNSCDNDSLTLAATQCRKRSTIAKKIFKSAHHARRRIKNQFPMIFVASVIKSISIEVWRCRWRRPGRSSPLPTFSRLSRSLAGATAAAGSDRRRGK